MTRIAITLLAATFLLCGGAAAKNVDLVTLPDRASVQLTIYNSDDITLVKETRSITLKKGRNQLQFSWANTLIDPTSVEFRPLEHSDEIEVAATVFPGQKPQHLIWDIQSQYEGQVKVEVSYFTAGLTWSMDYVAVCDPDEETMRFTGYIRVFNQSGEEYEDAQVRLIVGRINLVEKIADLARRRGIPVPPAGTVMGKNLRKESARRAMFAAEKAGRDDRAEAKKIVKEGLSEYFMFTVDGTETIRNGWSKRMPAVRTGRTKFDIVYRMRQHQYGPRPLRFFIWGNDEEHELGDAPLPDGRVRVFRENRKDGMSYLGEQLIRYVPIKAPIEVNLGTDDLVVYGTRRRSTERINFTFAGSRPHVVGWDERTGWIDEVRNYRGKPITFELRRQWQGHVDYRSEIRSELFDYRTVKIAFRVPARGRTLYPATVVRHLGNHAKQNRIDLR